MPQTFSPDEQAEIDRRLALLTDQQIRIDAGEDAQESYRDERADNVAYLKAQKVPRRLLVDATKHPGRPDGLSVEALDLAVKKRREALVMTNGDG